MATAAPLTRASDDRTPVAPTRSLLRFITCGSVDDGKSTLIGRLLHDSGALKADETAALSRDGAVDYSALVDGLAAEREQGITIDVAYRFFETASRRYIVADTPGHEQYTRNMATAASNADLAILLVDARLGVLAQTRRHAAIAHLFGVRRLVLAVNKMDLVGHDQARFDAIVADLRAFAVNAGIGHIDALPISGKLGENVVHRATTMDWYQGPTLFDILEQASPPGLSESAAAGRLAVQMVVRGREASDRHYLGRIAAGSLHVGDEVRILPGGSRSRIARMLSAGREVAFAGAGQSVAISLEDQRDCARGDLIVGDHAAILQAAAFDATLLWLSDTPLNRSRSYILRVGAAETPARFAGAGQTIRLDDFHAEPADGLALNGLGRFRIVLDRPLPLAKADDAPDLGRFILVDRASGDTVAAGIVSALTSISPRRLETAIQLVEPTAASSLAASVEQHGERPFILDRHVMADLADGAVGPAFRRRAIAAARLLAASGATVLITFPIDDAPADFVSRRLGENDNGETW